VQCVALDASEKRVAAGDASGRISVWHGFAPAVAAAFPEEAGAAPMEGVDGVAPSQDQGQGSHKSLRAEPDGGAAEDADADPDLADGPEPGQPAPAARKAAELRRLGARAPGGGGRVGGGGGGFAGPDAGLPRESLHWHAHAVGALAFGADAQGVYMLSGGLEAVLVRRGAGPACRRVLWGLHDRVCMSGWGRGVGRGGRRTSLASWTRASPRPAVARGPAGAARA